MCGAVLDAIEARAVEIAAVAESSERLGRLDDRSVALLREAGVMTRLQPAKYDGVEAHPAEFAEAVMKIASCDGSMRAMI